MLQIEIPEREYFDDVTGEFGTIKHTVLTLEHSLVSVSKWESKWCKPFLSSNEKTTEETLDYVRCMTTSSNVNPIVYKALTKENFEEIFNYINAPMTATWFNENNIGKPGRTSGETVTSELIYYWMIALQIPMECQRWHLNRLLTLIKVCNIKNTPAKQMSRSEILNQNRALNAARRKKH